MEHYSTRDIVAQSHLSIDFPAQYIATMNTPGVNNVGITDFYTAFCEKNNVSNSANSNAIFTPAAVLGHLYTSFLLPQQSLFDSLPQDNVDPEVWGIVVEKGKDKGGGLDYIARRMRNALSHNHVVISKSMDFTFWDAPPRIKTISEAEVIYTFKFDDLAFRFLRKWSECVVAILSGQQGVQPDAFGAG